MVCLQVLHKQDRSNADAILWSFLRLALFIGPAGRPSLYVAMRGLQEQVCLLFDEYTAASSNPQLRVSWC